MIDGVVNELVPLPPVNTVPPEAAAYQSTVVPAAAPVTLKFTVPVPHRSPLTATKGFEGSAFTVIVTVTQSDV